MERMGMNLAVQLGCKFGMSDCLLNAVSEFEKYPAEPDRDQKETVYCYGIQEGIKVPFIPYSHFC
jgi:hypothetical protein